MSLRLSTPQTQIATLRLIAAGKGSLAVQARAEIKRRLHAALRHARAS